MPIEVEATYTNGTLRLDAPVPLAEGERVVVQVRPRVSRIRQRAGAIKWTGDPETLRMIAEDPEFSVLEPK